MFRKLEYLFWCNYSIISLESKFFALPQTSKSMDPRTLLYLILGGIN